MSDHRYELRSYLWKGEPFLALYCDGRRLGRLAVSTDVSADMARRLGARLIELGEVRDTPTVMAARVAARSSGRLTD
jgi:hypothetical protein